MKSRTQPFPESNNDEDDDEVEQLSPQLTRCDKFI